MNSLGNFIQKIKNGYEFRIKRKQIELLFWKAIAEAAEGDDQFLEMTRNQDYYLNPFLQDNTELQRYVDINIIRFRKVQRNLHSFLLRENRSKTSLAATIHESVAHEKRRQLKTINIWSATQWFKHILIKLNKQAQHQLIKQLPQ